MWTPLKVEGRGVWTSAHPAGGRRGRAGIAQPEAEIKPTLTARRYSVPIGLHASCNISGSVRAVSTILAGRHPMDERQLRGLIDQVKAGGLSRRAFVRRLAMVGLAAPLAT